MTELHQKCLWWNKMTAYAAAFVFLTTVILWVFVSAEAAVGFSLPGLIGLFYMNIRRIILREMEKEETTDDT